MADSDIIRKIKKALAIAQDNAASDGEIQAAMNAVQKMMDRHHLTEDDLTHEPVDDYAAVDAANFNQIRAWIGRKVFYWESYLAQFVSKFVGVPLYVDNNLQIARQYGSGFMLLDSDGEPQKVKSFVFYGVAEDALIAKELYDELRLIIRTLAYGKYGTAYQGDGGRYAEGFVSGLFSQLEEQTKIRRIEAAGNSTAMVLIARQTDLVQYKERKAKDWLKAEANIKLRKGGRTSGASGSYGAFSDGRTDGSNAEVSKQRARKLTAR